MKDSPFIGKNIYLRIKLISLHYLYDFNFGQLEGKTYKLNIVLGYEEKQKLSETVPFLRSICLTLSCIKPLLKKIGFFDLIHIFPAKQHFVRIRFLHHFLQRKDVIYQALSKPLLNLLLILN